MKTLFAACALLAAASAFCAEDEKTVKLTTFELTDGRVIESARFSSMEAEGVKHFTITSLAGERTTISNAEIKEIKEKQVPASSLPETALSGPESAPKNPPASLYEGPVDVTVLKLNDGRTIEALDLVEKETPAMTYYAVVTPAGRKLSIDVEDVVSKKTTTVAFRTLPDEIRNNISKCRAGYKRALKVRTNAVLKAQNQIIKTNEELAAAKAVLEENQESIREIDVKIASEEANYHAAELQSYNNFGDYGAQRGIMVKSAAEKTRLGQARQPLADIVFKEKDHCGKLNDLLKTQQAELDAAKRYLAELIKTRPESFEIPPAADEKLTVPGLPPPKPKADKQTIKVEDD